MRLPARFGHVVIECEGGYPERWLNLAAEQGITLWDIRRREASLFCRAASADYRRLRPIARRAGVRMRVREKHGIAHRWRHRRLRAGVVCGAVLFAVLLQLLSSRIWVIRIVGNRTLSEETVRSALSELGIREGASFSDVDLTDLRLTALQTLPDVSWLGVHQSGSILTVELTERAENEPHDTTAPANIVAACDGIIVHIDTVCGQAAVGVGDAVRKGDLLISGVTDSKVGPTLKRADGRITARTTHTLTVTVPLAEVVTVPHRVISHPSLTLFGLTIPLYTKTAVPDGYRTVTERRPLTVGDIALPVGITETNLYYDTVRTVERSAEEAVAEAEKRLAESEAELASYFAVSDRSVTTQTSPHAITLTAVYHGTREIGTIVPIG